MSTPDRRYVVAWVVTVLCFRIPLLLFAYPSNPPLGNTGAPGEGTCSSCHGGGRGGGNVRIAFSGGGTTYTPGTEQTRAPMRTIGLSTRRRLRSIPWR
jgi:hypothetical protein